MNKKLLMFIFSLFATVLVGQVDQQTQLYRDDPKGDFKYRKEGVMDGNLVRTLFYNTGEVAQWPYSPSGEWPKGSGESYLDGVSVLVAAEVTAPNGQVIHPVQSYYREEMDRDPNTGEIWGFMPVPGYVEPSSKKPAINKDPSTFPATWPPALQLTPEWNGLWYGYFGRGVNNADFETFYVVDDSKDKEFTRAPYNYFPIAADQDRGGLGVRMEVRGFQWSHVLAEDIIFWHYDIVNISDFNYEKTAFGFYTDCGVGGPNDGGDNALFDRKLDIAYAWDSDGKGTPGNWKTGYYGYAYLESPGNGGNGIDDDEDGMIDERRDDNNDNDGDWLAYSDLNGNGAWDSTEPLNNDVGRDGVGPFDPQYSGPDLGEGDGLPTHGEPNFDMTDKDESDQIGLTAVSIYILSDKGPTGGWPKNDEVMWKKMMSGFADTTVQNTNISMVFASGPFPLNQGKRERFSMALVFGSNLEDLVFNKETVQQIYNANYNFSKPPITPTLTAVPGDKKVFLYWDSKAEESRDAFLGFEKNDPTLGYKKDFEGYLLYRSQEAEFQDIKVITDSKGEPKYWKPIAQWDLIDSIAGPDPVGINGAHFWRGSNTGLQHSYIDTTVLNGVRYYYALVAYDMGDPKFGTTGLQPTETTKIITEDFAGNLKFTDINTAVVTPNAPSAGYIPAQVIGNTSAVAEGMGTGRMDINILNPSEIIEGAKYNVLFNATGAAHNYTTTSYSVLRDLNGTIDTLITDVDSSNIGANKFSQPFDGVSVTILNDKTVNIIDTATGWLVGNSNLYITVIPGDPSTEKGVPWPADYEVQFFDTPQDTSYFHAPPVYTRFPVNFKVMNLTTGLKTKVVVKDKDLSQSLTIGDEIQIIEFVGTPSISNYRTAWKLYYGNSMNPNEEPRHPEAGDKYLIRTTKPFNTGDYFTFGIKPVSIDDELAKTELNKISVVPNPYIGTAVWERRNLNYTGRGERRIDFTNLPAKCVIRIYTIAGALVKTINRDSQISNGAESWNLVSEDGMDVAYGLYVYHVDAPGIGEFIGKFAIIK